MKNASFPLAHRLLHWAIAFSMLFMLLTIFLRLGWMNKHNMADIMTERLAEIDVTIDEDQAISIAKGIRSPMWAWHVYIGYVLVGLYLLRMLFFITKGSNFKHDLMKGALKEKVQPWSYVLFYALLASSLISGLIIEFGPEKYKHSTEEFHELSLYWLVLFIVVHFIGLYIAERTNRKGVVNKMITGREE
ncbi:MAG: cytochrome b/b6 domain-containing protein [Crocinitomicaceae bacterium]|nr:cytochrome b/b6 domain-containing protein [Crocinitomicaceae bacterium]